jgi:hypothetical protein
MKLQYLEMSLVKFGSIPFAMTADDAEIEVCQLSQNVTV